MDGVACCTTSKCSHGCAERMRLPVVSPQPEYRPTGAHQLVGGGGSWLAAGPTLSLLIRKIGNYLGRGRGRRIDPASTSSRSNWATR